MVFSNRRPSNNIIGAIARGLLSGVVGTLLVTLWSRGSARSRVYEPASMVGRLSRRYLRRDLPSDDLRRYGMILRWTYGPSWGALFGAAQRELGLPYPIAALGLGGALYLFELVALPLSGATPSLSRWGWGAVLDDAAQTMLFGVSVASLMALLEG
jgi:hypothetical protein